MLNDYAGNNTTRHATRRDFKNVLGQLVCWLLVAAVLPAAVYWMMGA